MGLKHKSKHEIKVGDKFNRLTVKDVFFCEKKHKTMVICVCSCGYELKPMLSYRVTQQQSCGCASQKCHVKIGEKYYYLKVISDSFLSKSGKHRLVKTVCDCGNLCDSFIPSLVKGLKKSCGKCNKRNIVKTHSLGSTRLYKIWYLMKYRCENKDTKAYINYGGKGIKICDEWLDVKNFVNWAISNGYKENLTIERNDPTKNYCPENCEWITKNENSKRRNSWYKNRIKELEEENKRLKEKINLLECNNDVITCNNLI